MAIQSATNVKSRFPKMKNQTQKKVERQVLNREEPALACSIPQSAFCIPQLKNPELQSKLEPGKNQTYYEKLLFIQRPEPLGRVLPV